MTKILEALNATITCFIEKVENLENEISELQEEIQSRKCTIQTLEEENQRLWQKEEKFEEEIYKQLNDIHNLSDETLELKKNLSFHEIELLSEPERIELTLKNEEKLQILKDTLTEESKIRAIKQLKDWSQGGLKGCKDAIDALEAEMYQRMSEE